MGEKLRGFGNWVKASSVCDRSMYCWIVEYLAIYSQRPGCRYRIVGNEGRLLSIYCHDVASLHFLRQ